MMRSKDQEDPNNKNEGQQFGLELDANLCLCTPCGNLLTNFYEAAKAFEKVWTKTSYLSLVFQNFHGTHSWSTFRSSTHKPLDNVLEERKSKEMKQLGQKSKKRRNECSDASVDVDGISDNKKTEPFTELPSLESIIANVRAKVKPTEEINEPSKKCQFLCQICAKGFEKNVYLKTHLLLSHGQGQKVKSYICFCGKSYYFQYLLRNHQRVHSEVKAFECETCGGPFKSRSALRTHRIEVHEIGLLKPIECELCEKRFKKIRGLEQHMISRHAGQPRFECTHCGHRYRRDRTLKKHLLLCPDRPPEPSLQSDQPILQAQEVQVQEDQETGQTSRESQNKELEGEPVPVEPQFIEVTTVNFEEILLCTTDELT